MQIEAREKFFPSKAFNEDQAVQLEVLRLIERFKIRTVIETGAFEGDTTEFFSDHLEQVISFEVMPESFHFCRGRLRNRNNVSLIGGDSAVLLDQVLGTLAEEQLLLFYLDAHSFNTSPLWREMESISRRCYDRAIVIIDDFKVPQRHLGYDMYQNVPNDLNFIDLRMNGIAHGVFFYFNHRTEVTNPTRNTAGKIYIFPQRLASLLVDFVNQDGPYFYSNI